MQDKKCGLCYMPPGRYGMSVDPLRPCCVVGEILYMDGSARMCPNYVKYMDELAEPLK